ncbi:MAG: hypothetical protein DRZ79_05595, partial [Candidatus Cloacimonadota bacterium]
MKTTVFLILLSMFLTLSSEVVPIKENANEQLFNCTFSNQTGTNLDFSLNRFEKETISQNGKRYTKISYWNEGEFLQIGKPDLPRFTRLVAIPDESDVSFEITSFKEEKISDILVYPRQELQSESKIEEKHFVVDEELYRNGNIFPEKIVELGKPAILRDFRVVAVTINPFRYDFQKHELKIITNLSLKIKYHDSNEKNVKILHHKQSRFFQPLYRSTIANYEFITSRDENFQQPSYLFIYPDDSAVASNLEILTEWKHQKGFQVVAASTAETGSTLQTIKNYIQDAYDNWENPPEFVCLVGDAGGNYNIPTDHMDPGYYNGEGDQSYALLEGDDILADVFLGRLSFNSLFELQTIIYKILNYEKIPYMGNTDWYNRALMVGDPTYSGQSCIDTKMHIRDMIRENDPNIECAEVYNAPWVSQMAYYLNQGVSYFNYRGFANMSEWDVSDINALTNGLMLPVVMHPTCITGDFEGTIDCRSEAFLKAGSPGAPKGAIAAIGTSTGNTHTCFNNCIDAGTYYGVFSDKIYNMGGALTRGKLNLYLCYPDNPANHTVQFSYWNNLMGDPGMEVWTGVPQNLVVEYPEQIALGTNYLHVSVTDDFGNPLQNVWVTALMENDEIFATGFTDENGIINLQISATQTGMVNLTATKHNFIPHLGTFAIVQGDVFVNVESFEIDDDNSGTSNGNGDGNINPGENIELRVNLRNFGNIDATSVSATISSESNFISITDDTENYGNIAAGTSAFSDDDFDISIGANALGGAEIPLNIQIEDDAGHQWNDIISLLVFGPNLHPQNYTVYDTNNGIFDAGETAEFSVSVSNIGSVEAEDIYGTIGCDNEFV